MLKNVPATPPPLAKTKMTRSATIATAAAQPMEISASSRPRAATRRAATSSSAASSRARSLAFPNARMAGIHAYRLKTTSTMPTIVETGPSWL